MPTSLVFPASVNYRTELKPKAEKDPNALSSADRVRVVQRLQWLEDDLCENVKRLHPIISRNTG